MLKFEQNTQESLTHWEGYVLLNPVENVLNAPAFPHILAQQHMANCHSRPWGCLEASFATAALPLWRAPDYTALAQERPRFNTASSVPITAKSKNHKFTTLSGKTVCTTKQDNSLSGAPN